MAQIFAQTNKPQTIVSKPCACGTWNPLVLRQATGSMKYECNSRIEWSCNHSFQFTTSYQCSPSDASCQAKTTWDVRNGNTIIKSGTGTNNISDGFTLTANGTYTLTLNASCNGIKCPPCTYTIIIKDCLTCDCGSWSGKPIKYQSTTSPTSPALQGTINCNDSFTLPMGAYTFTAPDYKCSSSDCLTYDWTFRSPNNFQATQRGTNILPLDFTNGNYGGYGTYTIYIYAKCGGKSCGTCEFKVVIVNKTTTTKSMSTPNTNTDNPPSKTITRNWIADDTTTSKAKKGATPTLSEPGKIAH